MSVRVMSLVWDEFPRGGSDKLVMLAMADWCNDQGGSLHPSHAAVAKKCCMSRVQAQRIIRLLEGEGWLLVVGNQYGGAPGMTKQYRLNIEKLKNQDGYQDDTGISGDTGITEDTGITQVRDGYHLGAQTGIASDTQTTIEPPRTTIADEQAHPADIGRDGKKTTFAKFIETCKAKGEKAIPDDDPVFKYAETVGIDTEMLEIAWREFKGYWLTGEGKSKRRTDWRGTYLNAVKQNRARLWFIRPGENASWTTVGEQAKRAAA